DESTNQTTPSEARSQAARTLGDGRGSDPRSSFAAEGLRIVGIAHAVPDGDRRKRAQRSRHVSLAVASAGGDDAVGCLSVFDPVIEGAEEVRLVRSDTAAAVADARHQEQAHPVVLFWLSQTRKS